MTEIGLRRNAVGLREVLFQSITDMAPGAAIAASIPAGVAFAGGALPLAVVFALIACLFSAWSIGQLARELPSSGSMATYAARGLHPAVGFLAAWAYAMVGWLIPPLVLLQLGFTTAGTLHAVPNPHGNGPARTFAYDGAPGTVGVISPLAHDYCERCNRVRLSADGRLKLCLFGDNHIDLRTPLRTGGGQSAIESILRASMHVKPERHHLQLGEVSSQMRAFSEIGG